MMILPEVSKNAKVYEKNFSVRDSLTGSRAFLKI